MPESQIWSITGCPTLLQLRDAEREQVPVEFEVTNENGKRKALRVVTLWIDANTEPLISVIGFVEKSLEEVSACFCPRSQEWSKGEMKVVPTSLVRKATPLQSLRRSIDGFGYSRT